MHSWPRRLRVSCSVLSAEGFPTYCAAVFEAGRYKMWDRKALTLLRATSVQNPRIFAQCSWLEAGKGKRNQRDLALTPWAHNPKVGGSNPPPATDVFRSSPETWVTECTGYIGNSFGPKGFSSGSSTRVSRSKYPKS